MVEQDGVVVEHAVDLDAPSRDLWSSRPEFQCDHAHRVYTPQGRRRMMPVGVTVATIQVFGVSQSPSPPEQQAVGVSSRHSRPLFLAGWQSARRDGPRASTSTGIRSADGRWRPHCCRWSRTGQWASPVRLRPQRKCDAGAGRDRVPRHGQKASGGERGRGSGPGCSLHAPTVGANSTNHQR